MAYVPTSTSASAAGSVLPQTMVPDSQSRRPSVTVPPVFVSRTYSSFTSYYVSTRLAIALHVFHLITECLNCVEPNDDGDGTLMQ